MSVYRKVMRAKIHGAVITHADLEYEGSLTIPPELLELTDIREYEAVSVWNVTRGTRFETYAITGDAGSDIIAANGAAAHLAKPGDRVIITTFADVEESMLEKFQPKIVFIGKNNKDITVRGEVPGPLKQVV